jgi:transposase
MNYYVKYDGKFKYNGDIKYDVSANELSSNERSLLAAFPIISFSKEEVAETLGISESGAYKLLQRMQERGLLSSRKSGKKWLYTAGKASSD